MSRASTDRIARELRTRGLAAPALLLLEAHRPLRPLLGLAATAVLPLARPLLGSRVGRLKETLDDEAAYDQLIDELRTEALG